MRIEPVKTLILKEELSAAPDKSITHRAVMFNSFAEGGAVIENALLGEDCISTIECMRALGAGIEVEGDTVRISKPVDTGAVKGKRFDLYAGNSGTTIRLLAGLLCGRGVYARLTGDASIAKRPMERVAAPLRALGADIRTADGHTPIDISPACLRGADIVTATPSAQVKSAILLAGLTAEGATTVREKAVTRDHTEIMLKTMGADIETARGADGNTVTIKPSALKGTDIKVGGDISSAAYWLVLGAVVPGAGVTLRNININPTRTGILTVMKQAGCNISFSGVKEEGGEPTADITVTYTEGLKPFEISGAIVPLLIDEIPVLAVLACFINGTSVIRNAAELKVKESDRIAAVVNNLKKMGADIMATDDGMIINGRGFLTAAKKTIKTSGDHRIAMSMAVAALAGGGAEIDDIGCCAVSYPSFLNELGKIWRPGIGSGAKRYALIGADIGYSVSKRVHENMYAAAGISAEYSVISAGADFLKNIKENMAGFSGFNVTKPYKTQIIPYLDALDGSALICGAVNTVVISDGKYIGHNTDGRGFIESMKYHNVKFEGKKILILGAGGAARAVISALRAADLKYAHMRIYNRSAGRAEQLKKDLNYAGLEVLYGLPSNAGADIVINCTTAGLDGTSCPLDEGFDYKRLTHCIDLIYNPAMTPMLIKAAAAGVNTVNGAAMLVFQAAAAERLWQDIKLTDKALDAIINK